MATNKIKRYSSLHELEVDLNNMNEQWWFIKTMSDNNGRVLVAYEFDKSFLNDNNIQDGEDTVVLDTMEVENTETVPETSWDSEGS